MSSLVCLGRPTVTGLLSTAGLQFRDWTAAYRLFAWDRIDMSRLFSIICREASKELPHDGTRITEVTELIQTLSEEQKAA